MTKFFPEPFPATAPKVLGETTAWRAIGFEGSEFDIDSIFDGKVEVDFKGRTEALLRIKGGRTLYEDAHFSDDGRARKVRLSYIDTANGLRGVHRYVDGDTVLEVVVPDDIEQMQGMIERVCFNNRCVRKDPFFEARCPNCGTMDDVVARLA